MTEQEHHHDHGHQEVDHHHDGHGHDGHHHGYNAESLGSNDAYYGEVYGQIIEWLGVSEGFTALDAGPGAGGFTSLLARAVGESGSVTALDESDDLLKAAAERMAADHLAERVTFLRGDIAEIPLPDGQFDLVWSSCTVHHLPDQVAALRQLARVLKPGGRLALREGGIRPRFLPEDIGIGEPGLEERLDAAYERWFYGNVRGGKDVVRYPFGWVQLLRDAWLRDVTARTFLMEFLPPFTDVQIAYMGRHFRRWLESEDRRALLEPSDARTLELLTDATSEHFVFNRPDLHLREGVTVYVGRA